MKRSLPILALLAVAACKPPGRPPDEPSTGRSSVASRWVRVRAPLGLSLLEAPAQVVVQPESNAAVTPPFQARVVRVPVQAGDRIGRGAVVAEVVMPQVTAAGGAYAGARARLEAYGRRKEQLEALRKEGLVRLAEIAEVETRLAEARSDFQVALATLRGAGLGGEDVPSLLDGRGTVTLRSPVAGTVIEVQASLGETREPGGPPLVRVAGEGQTRIAARLSHRLPERARYELVTSGGERLAVQLVSQAPNVDPRDGTVPAWFQPEGGTRLAQGAMGKLRVLLDPTSGVVAVPSSAVGSRDGKPFVVVRQGEGEKVVDVVVLSTSGADALVRGELAIEDEIAAEAPAAPPPTGGAGS